MVAALNIKPWRVLIDTGKDEPVIVGTVELSIDTAADGTVTADFRRQRRELKRLLRAAARAV
ncbi:hypothetical protein D9V30_10260 [Mycetocola reblochoni]|nr:hypothetical protein D9V30_10260 [Mycetocola reblochoni]